ncbi:MAG: hypothetical protein GXP28_11470 [Planctomycetes bacterium]|nr:hypothetical protein [Planctomycetota bacterium]
MSFLKHFFSPLGSIFTDPEYQAAYRFKDVFLPDKDKDYEWVAEYARFTFDQLQKANDTLDKKSESIMRVLGGGSGLLSLGAVLNLTKIGVATAFGLLSALALVAVVVAVWVRVPQNTLLPPIG